MPDVTQNAAVRRLSAIAQRDDTEPAHVRAALTELLAMDDVVGVAVVFDILAREPRIRPSRRLVIDPADAVHRRWGQRVAAAAALLESAAATRVADELLDELADAPALAHDVLASARPHAAVSDSIRRRLGEQ